jgi:hypothetical protein
VKVLVDQLDNELRRVLKEVSSYGSALAWKE